MWLEAIESAVIWSDCLNEKLELWIRSKAVAVGRWDRRDLERVKFSGGRARVSCPVERGN